MWALLCDTAWAMQTFTLLMAIFPLPLKTQGHAFHVCHTQAYKNNKGDQDQTTWGFPLWKRKGHCFYLQETGGWGSGWGPHPTNAPQMVLPHPSGQNFTTRNAFFFFFSGGGLLGMWSRLCLPLPTHPICFLLRAKPEICLRFGGKVLTFK